MLSQALGTLLRFLNIPLGWIGAETFVRGWSHFVFQQINVVKTRSILEVLITPPPPLPLFPSFLLAPKSSTSKSSESCSHSICSGIRIFGIWMEMSSSVEVVCLQVPASNRSSSPRRSKSWSVQTLLLLSTSKERGFAFISPQAASPPLQESWLGDEGVVGGVLVGPSANSLLQQVESLAILGEGRRCAFV